MNRTLVLSILSDDRPGIVETLARVINEHNGNWLESRLSHLAGKFAGILQINLPANQIEPLQNALAELQSLHGIQVASAEAIDAIASATTTSLRFTLVGNDRPGIVRELSQAFLSHHINVEDLQTHCSSMPWTGDPMFTANGLLKLPESVDTERLGEQLDAIADQLDVEIDLTEPEPQ